LNKEEYEEAKRKALQMKKATRNEMKWKKQRDALLYLLKRSTEWPLNTIARELTVVTGEPVSETVISQGIANITHQKTDDIK
jgi:hypothetical protein